MTMRYAALIVLICVLNSAALVQAQDDGACAEQVQAALTSVDAACSPIGRNQVCYGSPPLQALPEGLLNTPGDTADLAQIDSLSLSRLDVPEAWGVALMRIQANLPDQNVTLLLFGKVEIDKVSGALPGPSNGTISSITELAGSVFGPMQAFAFRSGLGETRCQGVPPDGILVQTPAGAGEIPLQANQVDLWLSATAFLQAIPSDVMTIDVIAGQGRVTALGTTIIVPAGARAIIPLDEAGLAAGPPELAAYTEDDVADLPLSLLPESVEIAAPLDESRLRGHDVLGDWVYTDTLGRMTCSSDETLVAFNGLHAGDASTWNAARTALS